jgi:predicted RNA-binding Zn-ribbon protein involved in translation (DUF1610 family)
MYVNIHIRFPARQEGKGFVAGRAAGCDNLVMRATADFHCPKCGAEIMGDSRKSGAGPCRESDCPYSGLEYAVLRAGHDAIYFGPWRRMDASPLEIRRAYHRIGRHLAAIGEILGGRDLPAASRDLALAFDAYHAADPKAESADALRFMDNALSYAHQAIDALLRERGLSPHRPMDFSEWYDAVEVPFRDEL